MTEDNLPDFIYDVMKSGITVKEQKLIRDILFEINHLPLEEEPYEECEWQGKYLLREEQE